MASLKDAASLINELSQDTQLELYKSWQSNQEAAVSRLVEIAKGKGKAGYDAATVKRLIEEFIADVQKNDENEDVQISEAELTAVSGGCGPGADGKRLATRKNDKAWGAAMAERNAIRDER